MIPKFRCPISQIDGRFGYAAENRNFMLHGKGAPGNCGASDLATIWGFTGRIAIT